MVAQGINDLTATTAPWELPYYQMTMLLMLLMMMLMLECTSAD